MVTSQVLCVVYWDNNEVMVRFIMPWCACAESKLVNLFVCFRMSNLVAQISQRQLKENAG